MSETQRTFTFSNGVTVRLKKISQFMLTRLLVDNTAKFEIPQKLVTLGTRKEEKLIPDYDNPVFINLVMEQQNRDRAETLGNLSVFAVIDDVPENEYAFYEEVAIASRGSEVSKAFIKSLWLLDMIQTEEELSDFQEAILGINHVTKVGLEKAQEKFPDSD